MATPCGRNALFKAVALQVVVVSCAVCSAGFCAEESPLVLFTAITGRPGAKEAAEYLDAAQDAGFSQMMLYPRSGLESEYMGEEWLSFVGNCLAEARRRGMKVWLYDEYNWPSGSCRGRVPMENPEWTYTEYAVRKSVDGSFSWEVKRNDQMSMYDKYFDVNAYSSDAIRRFIELTHKVYERHFASYMKDGTIPGVFTDEPAHPSNMKWDDPQPIVTFRWWNELESQYRERTGREFRSDVEDSLRDPSKTAVWEIYTELKGHQFRRAYFDQIRAWARKAGIATCGHMISENSPLEACNFNGLPLNSLRGLTIPGMDKIHARMDKGDEWLTYATAQYAIERNSTPGGYVLDSHGGIELFALGPCDLTIEQLVQRIWVAALHGMDTYFTSLYHTTARGFLEKGGFAMFVSPTQPWFEHCGDLHDAARKAAKWSRKRFVRDVAVRYPQRLSGRLALGRAAPGERCPPLCELVNEFAWRQIPFELIQDDEKSELKYVFSFRGEDVVEEWTGRVFQFPDAVADWLHRERKDAWRVTDANGAIVSGLLVRRYADGTAAVLNMTQRNLDGLRLVRGGAGEIAFALPACGVRLFAEEERGWTPKRIIGDVATGGWTISRDRDTLHRVWFSSNNTARLVAKVPLNGVRFAVCDYPKGSVNVVLDGRQLVANGPSKCAPYGYAPIYRETEPLELAAGTHELILQGRADDSVFLPALWLAGDFAVEGSDMLLPADDSIPRLAPLSNIGYRDFSGVATYRTTVRVPNDPGVVLALDTGGLLAYVRLGGRDLGEKALPPWEWAVPQDLLGKDLLLEVSVVTSIRPVFGQEDAHGVELRERLWTKTQLNAERSGLCSAKWMAAEAADCTKVEFAAPFSDGAVLQRGREVPVWGRAEPGAKVKVSFAGMERETTANADGRWSVVLGAMEASYDGLTLSAESGGSKAEAKDVLVGEVWFCAGQSNAAMPLWGRNPHGRDAKGAMRAQMTHKPLVRFCEGKGWKPFTPENLMAEGSFSAMGAYFALEIHSALGIPVGIVGAYRGATGIETWTPRGFVQQGDMANSNVEACNLPSVLWDELVAPWTPFAIRGVIWYQGCHNSREGRGYADKMHALYNGWSKEFKNPDLKFYFAQLVACIRRAPGITRDWDVNRIATTEGQAEFAASEKNAGMVVINDVGNVEDIHPSDKETVGQRLALLALKRDYGFDGIKAESPTLGDWKVDGDKFVLSFENAEGWYLYHSDWSTASGFEIAGEDGNFVPAVIENLIVKEQCCYKSNGIIEGKDLVVRAPGVKEPKKLRYLFSSPWYGALHNEVGLPLGAFHIESKDETKKE